MSRRNWKRVRASSLIEALRLCKEFAQERHNLGVERIADRMGVTHDSLYKWLATGRMPAILLPTYEHACGCHFASLWLAGQAGKLVIDRPSGKAVTQVDMVEFNSGFARALQLLSDFYENPAEADATTTMAALSAHLEQVAFHHRGVSTYATPELDFA